MAASKRDGASAESFMRDGQGSTAAIGPAVRRAVELGFVIGREVMVGRVPGIIVGYNIAGMGCFVGSDFPLVVRTALGVAKCSAGELELI